MKAKRARDAQRGGRKARRAAPVGGDRSRERPPKSRRPTFEEIAAQIAAAEQELADAGRLMADPELYRDGERTKTTRARYDDAQRRLEDLYQLLASVEAAGREAGFRGGATPRGRVFWCPSGPEVKHPAGLARVPAQPPADRR